MSIVILDPTTAANVAAAVSQEAQRAALFAPFGSADVTVRAMNGATLRETMTYGAWAFNSSTPRGATLGALLARSVASTGAPTHFVFRAGSTDVFSMTGAVSPGVADIVLPAAGGGIMVTARTNLSDASVSKVTISANPALPVTSAVATAFTLSLSANSGTNGVAITVTVTPNGPIPTGGASVTLAASNGGVLGSTSLSFTSGSSAAQSTTLTRSTAGTSTVTMTNSGGLTNAGSPTTFTSAAALPPPSPGALPTLTLLGADGAAKPFAVGHVFKQGDVPAGSSIVMTGASVNGQATIKSTWPDGSAKIAVLAGTATISGGTAALALSSGAAASVTALTTTDLIATGVTANVDAGAFGSAAFGNTEWAAPFEAWVSGPRMSSWIYRKQIGSDAHLVAWLEVRLFAGGAVEVLPWVENGYFNVASPTSKSATYAFTLGGTSRFSAAIDLPAHCRTPLVSGAALSHWLGADPGVIAKHDAAYLMATRLVPTYSATVASGAARVAALPAAYTPLQVGSFEASMGSAGYQQAIGLLPEWDVLYLTTTGADAAVYGGVVRNGYSAGRWGIHFRDETTNRPIRFSAYPNTVVWDNSGASTTGTYTPTPSGTAAPIWDIPHHPSVGYMAYLITGRWYFMEEVLFAATRNYLFQPDAVRQESEGVFRTSSGASTFRGAAWAIRTLAQAATVVPDADATLRAEFVSSLESNINFNHTRYCAQPNNPFGIVESYGDNSGGSDGRWTTATWQMDFHTAAWGYALALNPGVSAANKAKLHEFFHWTAQSVVGRLQGTTGSEWLYRDPVPYLITVASSDSPDWATGAGPWPANWGAMYDLSYDGSAVAEANPGSRVEGDLRGGNFPSATSYWGNMQPALAYAVEHGVSGAALAYARMTGASNWSSLTANFDADPVWSVAPRTVAAPAWQSSQAVYEWREITGTAASLTVPSPAPAGDPLTRITAWNSLAVLFDELLSVANGGHADWAGNESLGNNLRADAPGAFALLRTATAAASVTENTDEYADGRPTSSHSYYDNFGIPALNRVLRFGIGSGWGNGNHATSKVHAFNRHTDDYDAAATWPSPTQGMFRGRGKCVNPNNGDIYVMGDSRLMRFSPSTRTWSLLATHIQNGDAAYYRALAFDARRNRLIVMGDAFRTPTGCLIYDVTTDAWSQSDLTGSYASAVAAQVGNQAYYHAPSDRFLVKVNSGGADVVVVHPTTFSTSMLSTTGATPNTAQNGVFGLWVPMPSLGGFAYLSSGNSNIFFLRTE